VFAKAHGIPLATIAAIMGRNAKTNADFYQREAPALALIAINLCTLTTPGPKSRNRPRRLDNLTFAPRAGNLQVKRHGGEL
jgi:hypothetical protein